MKKIKILLLLATATLIFSCDSTTYQDIQPVVTNPTFVANIAPVVSAKCAGCHAGGNQYPNLETYDEVKDACINGSVTCRIDASCGRIMPQDGKMSQAIIDQIKLWTANGCPN